MSVEVNHITACKKSLNIEVPVEVVDAAFAEVTQKYAKGIRLPGFRPGKVPPNIIKQRFAKEIKAEIVHDFVEKYTKEAIQSTGLNPISQPVVDPPELESGKPFKFSATFEIWPEITVNDYLEMPISVKKEFEITDEEIQGVLRHYQAAAATVVPVEDRVVKDGDLVTLDLRGVYMENSKERTFEETGTIEVGGERVHPGLSENVRGLKVGEEKELTIDYPADYRDRRVAGKSIRHTLKVVEVKETVLPEINDEFAKDVSSFENLEQFRADIKKELQEQARKDAEEEAKGELLKRLAEQNPIEVPEVLISAQLKAILGEARQVVKQQMARAEQEKFDWNKFAEAQRPRAVQEVQHILILDYICKREGLEVLPAEVDMELGRTAKALGMSMEALRARYEKEGRLEELMDKLKYKKALDFIYQHAKINNV